MTDTPGIFPASVPGAFTQALEPFTLLDLGGKSVVNNARVDFGAFLLRSKIDTLVFACKMEDLAPEELRKIQENIKVGRLETPKDRRNWGGRNRPWLAVHDPSFREQQFVVERFWNSQVLKIEFAVDAHLPRGSNELYRLDVLKGQLRHCLFPQAHDRLSLATRKKFALGLNRYRADGQGTPLPATQIIWERSEADHQLALYIKERDNDKSVGQPWVRIEARLEGSGPSRAGLDRVGMLPHFAANLRHYLGPMFRVASGFKNNDELVMHAGVPRDPWAKWGAQWGGKGDARLMPDAVANRAIGAALNELRSSLMRLKPPTAVAHRYEEWIEEFSPF